MKDLATAASQLREMATELDSLQKAMAMPVQNVDIPGAVKALKAGLPCDMHFSIRPPHFDLYSFDNNLCVGKWSIYLGIEAGEAHGSHEGITLSEAVNTALAACHPEQHGNADAEIAAITEAFAEPIPL